MDKSQYLDLDGYPGTRQADGSFDGGDTAAIMGTVGTLAPMAASVLFPMEYPWDKVKQAPIRHPSQPAHSAPENFSRDQLIPELCSFVVDPAREAELARLRTAHAKRGYLTSWNGDITGPEIWALWLRILKPWWMYFFLWLLDIETLVNTFLWRWWRDDRVCRNHMLVCLAIQKHSPTFVGRAAYRLLNWEDLLSRWEAHCKAVGEYPTYDLFRGAYAWLKSRSH